MGLIDSLLVPVAVLYLVVVGSLFLYGINFFYLTYISLKRQDQDVSQRLTAPLPQVTIQLPIFNEVNVVRRLIRAAAALDYPQDLLEIQVLDDSTDGTAATAAAEVRRLRDEGLDIHHLHREERHGFKAGALQMGLERARGEFIVIFDADFVPAEDFLLRTLPSFTNPQVAFVQTRWAHLNRDFSFLTLLQSLAIDAHFMIEQSARHQLGLWFNFNGTAGVWRRAAIEHAGGWQCETLTEDLDLSYRAFLRGWKAVFLSDVDVPAELPASYHAYRRQQHRWARGSLECARKFLPLVWKSRQSWQVKAAATLHLTGYCVHLLLFGLSLLYPLVLLLSRQYADLISLFGLAALFNATALAPTTFFIGAQKRLGRKVWRAVPQVLFLSALGAGMMLNTVRAAAQVVLGRPAVFRRTPKSGLVSRRETPKFGTYRLRFDTLAILEFGFGLFNLATAYLAVQANNWFIALYALIFALGLIYVSGASVLQSIRERRA